jgi:hypothetical protein
VYPGGGKKQANLSGLTFFGTKAFPPIFRRPSLFDILSPGLTFWGDASTLNAMLDARYWILVEHRESSIGNRVVL